MLDHHHHCRDHDHQPAEPLDPASQSLADALRVSFKLLTVIMVLVLAGFMLSGLQIIEAQQMGVKKVFGRVVGTAGQGLAYTWPFPVGQIEIVDVSERELQIEDFWVHETPEDKTKKGLAEYAVASQGLRPGWDGALLTGDQNLLHARMSCKWSVQDPAAFLSAVGDADEMIRSAACAAAIRLAAATTADSIKRSPVAFADAVRSQAQIRLNSLIGPDVIRLTRISMTADWPVRAQGAYAEAQRARDEARDRATMAKGEARTVLLSAAGPCYEALVGAVAPAGAANQPQDRNGKDYDLIGQYERTRAAMTQTHQQLAQAQTAAQAQDLSRRLAELSSRAEELLGRIDAVLESPQATGEVSAVIGQARSAAAVIEQSAKGRAVRFAELIGGYEESPQLLIQRSWAEVRDFILGAPLNEKFYVTTNSGQKTVLIVNRDPEVTRQMRSEQLKLNPQAGPGR